MTNKHTPGPWRACHDGKCQCRMIWSIQHDVPVAAALSARNASYTCGDGIDDDEVLAANARLIAAAPNTIVALENLRGAFAAICNDHGIDPNKLSRYREAKAALSEALGECRCDRDFEVHPCGTSTPPGELAANATLIAAAPELLSTLDAMVTLHDSGEQISATWWGAARYVIAKARGDR